MRPIHTDTTKLCVYIADFVVHLKRAKSETSTEHIYRRDIYIATVLYMVKHEFRKERQFSCQNQRKREKINKKQAKTHEIRYCHQEQMLLRMQ